MNLENEVWKDIPNYEGLYQVSNLGRVKSLDRLFPRIDGASIKKKGHIISQSLRTYYQVQLRKDKKSVHFDVHRLVCMAFHPNPNNYPCVNHKDEDKLNNRAENLEWCTQQYNVRYGEKAKTKRERFINKFGKKICAYNKYGDLVQVFPSVSKVEDRGFNRRSVVSCLSRRLDSHKGLVFRYDGEPFSYKNRSLNVFVRKFAEDGRFVREYNTISEAARDNSLTKDKLGSIYRGKQPNVPINGFKYEFYHP